MSGYPWVLDPFADSATPPVATGASGYGGLTATVENPFAALRGTGLLQATLPAALAASGILRFLGSLNQPTQAAGLAASGTEWHPLDLGSTLKLWLAAFGTLTKDGSNRVSSWNDDSGIGTGPYIKATDGEKPLYVANAYNGMPTLRGIGSPGGLTAATAWSFGSALTLVWAMKRGTLAAYDLASTASTGDIISNVSGALVEWFGATLDRNTLSNGATGLHVYAITQTNGAHLRGYLDGTKVFDKAVAASALEDLKHIFGRVNGLSGSDCDIPEIVGCDTVIADATLSKAINYMGRKYGVSGF